MRPVLLLGDHIKENDVQSLLQAAQSILNLGVRDYVILHSSFGAVAVSSAGETAVQGSVLMTEDLIKGAAGAGDAFAAGVILGMHDSKSMNSCLKMGVCSAASCLWIRLLQEVLCVWINVWIWVINTDFDLLSNLP